MNSILEIMLPKKLLFLLVLAIHGLSFALILPANTSERKAQHELNTAKKNSTYYVSATGNDNNKGTETAPWKTLKKISEITLNPGDKVCFNRGDRFDGHYIVRGSGSKKNPIIISAYGVGPKPIITGMVGAKGGGDFREAVLVENVSHIVFEHLEIQNERLVSRPGVKDTDAFGISVHNSSDEIMRNISFRKMIFKNVFAVQPILEKSSFDAIQVSGLRFTCTKNKVKGKEKNIQDIRIEHSEFTHLQRLGIQFKHNGGLKGVGNASINRNMNIVVRNNVFSYNGGTGVLPNATYNCLIEHNLFDHPGASTDPRMPGRGSSIWNYNSINTVMQYNVCLSTRGWLDSYGIHIDNHNKNTFVQYNYMEDCEGGFVEILRGNKNAVYRFNVSVNDGWRVNENWNTSNHTIWVHAVRHKKEDFKPNDHIYIHNNTVVINKPFKNRTFTSVVMDASNLNVYNNIFSSTGGGPTIGGHFAVKPESVVGGPINITNNLFHGNIGQKFLKQDQNPTLNDPIFVGLHEGKFAYQLNEKSAGINAGIPLQSPVIPGAGKGVFKHISPYPTVDFYGNTIDLSSGTPNIGAYNGKSASDISIPVKEWSKKSTVSVYPNSDLNNVVIIDNSYFKAGEVKVSLNDVTGAHLFEEKIAVTSEQQRLTLNLPATLPNGIYQINVDNKGKKHRQKLVYFKSQKH